jgi:hypothetical protein
VNVSYILEDFQEYNKDKFVQCLTVSDVFANVRKYCTGRDNITPDYRESQIYLTIQTSADPRGQTSINMSKSNLMVVLP